MAFSLSRRSFSRALGWYRCPFNLLVLVRLVVLVRLFVLLVFLGGAAFYAIIVHQVRAESIERNNFVSITFNDRRARHPADDASIFTLRDGHSPGGLDFASTLGAVLAQPGHQ